MFQTVFKTALTDTHAIPGKEQLGALRVEIDGKYGERWFRYVQNDSAGSLAIKSSVMYDGVYKTSAVTAVASGSSTTTVARATGSFITDGVKVDDMIYVLDDAGGAGAAPEGEMSFVTKVEALKLTFSPAVSAAVGVGDTVDIIKRWNIIASAAKAGKRYAGVLMATIASGYCGWVQVRGIHPKALVVAAGTAIAEGDRLAPGTGILTIMSTVAANANVDTDINEVAVATALRTVTTDTVLRECIVMLECM